MVNCARVLNAYRPGHAPGSLVLIAGRSQGPGCHLSRTDPSTDPSMEGKLGEHHSGQLKRQSAQAKAERIIAEELQRRGWKEQDLKQRRKSDSGKLELASRLGRET